MKAMIQNDVDKSWMLPLLELRNELDFRGDNQRQRDIERRDFRRLRGSPQLNRTGDELIPGPYTQEARANWLTRLLKAQSTIRRNASAPAHVRQIELISRKELQLIRRIWIEDKHEFEDLLPRIYEQATGEPYGEAQDDGPMLGPDALEVLKEVSKGDSLHYDTLRNLMHIEHQFRRGGTTIARRGLFRELEASISSGFFTGKDDALAWAKSHAVSATELLEGNEDFRLQEHPSDRAPADVTAAKPLSRNRTDDEETTRAL